MWLKRQRIMGKEREKVSAELRTKYEHGASLRDLAAETGRSYGFIQRIVSESGVTMRGRTGRKPRTTPTTTPPQSPKN